MQSSPGLRRRPPSSHRGDPRSRLRHAVRRPLDDRGHVSHHASHHAERPDAARPAEGQGLHPHNRERRAHDCGGERDATHEGRWRVSAGRDAFCGGRGAGSGPVGGVWRGRCSPAKKSARPATSGASRWACVLARMASTATAASDCGRGGEVWAGLGSAGWPGASDRACGTSREVAWRASYRRVSLVPTPGSRVGGCAGRWSPRRTPPGATDLRARAGNQAEDFTATMRQISRARLDPPGPCAPRRQSSATASAAAVGPTRRRPGWTPGLA